MRKAEIKVGGIYTARVNGNHTTVRVDEIRDTGGVSGTHYHVTDLKTAKKTVFHSAAKFHSEVRNETNANQWSVADANHQPTQGIIGKLDMPPESEPVLDISDMDITHAEFDAAMMRNSELAPPENEDNWQPECDSVPTIEQVKQMFAAKDLAAELEGKQCSDPMDLVAAPVVADPAPVTAPVNTSFAARVAAAQTSRLSRIPETVAGYKPTDEQRAILEKILELLASDEPKTLVVNAGAGSGKTSLLIMAEEILYGQIQYTAYNRPLINESKRKLRKAKCSTEHGLAFAPVGRDYQHRLNGSRVRSWAIAQRLGIEDYSIAGEPYPKGSPEWTEAANAAGYNNTDKLPPDTFNPCPIKQLKAAFLAGQVSQALKKFSQTADRDIAAKHFSYIPGIDEVDEFGRRARKNNDLVVQYLLPFAHKFWADVCNKDGVLPFQHDYYVKMWQLSENAIIPADHILLDEHQDTAPVFADVIRRQSATVVLVGDENQRIYEWRGAMNAADLFPEAPVLYLSQSFRFGQTVADVANSVLSNMQERTKLNMKGLKSIPSRVLLELPTDEYGNKTADNRKDEYVGTVCYLYRSNAGTIARILSEYMEGRHGCLIGNIKEVVKFVKGARNLQNNMKTDCPDLAAFDNWKEVQEYVEEDPDGGDLELMVKLVDKFGCDPILEALENMPSEDKADFVCSTSHKSKGREWDTVVLGSDFPPAHKMNDSDCRLLYVAATRAKLVLDITTCTPFHRYRDKDGHEYPCIKVDFTTTQPTREELSTYLVEKSAPKIDSKATQSVNGNYIAHAQKNAAEANVAKGNGILGGVNSRPPATGFTWTNFSNKWCVRGPVGAELNTKVKIMRKDGTESHALLKKVVREFPDACIYEV